LASFEQNVSGQAIIKDAIYFVFFLEGPN
jgi:hypothetical protein